MMKMRKKIIYLLAFLALTCAFYAAIFFYASKGEPFLAVKTYLIKPQAVPELGDVEEVKLTPFSSYHERLYGSDGEAHLSVTVTGTKGKKVAAVVMQKRDDKWAVQSITVDGKLLPIKTGG